MMNRLFVAACIGVACSGPDPVTPEPGDPVVPTDTDGDGFLSDLDCDDGDDAVYPGAPDHCGDDRVTDCGRTADDGLVTLDGATTFEDLGQALAAAGAGAELVVCPGVYTGPFVLEVPLTLIALHGAEVTILSGANTGPTLSVPADSRIVGFTIRDGQGDTGGGLVQATPGALTVEASVVSDNTAARGGGIGLVSGSMVTLVDTIVERNQATAGGGGVWVPADTTLFLGASEIRDNVAVDHGGGLAVEDAAVEGGVVSGNRVSATHSPPGCDRYGGGGIEASGLVTVTGTAILSNQAPKGAGISAHAGETTLVDVAVTDNDAVDSDDWAGLGGGATVECGVLRLEGASTLSANSATGGGGVYLDGGLVGGTVTANDALIGGGMIVTGSSTVDAVTIEENSAQYEGGGVYAAQAELTVTGSFVIGNQGWVGGGVFASESSVVIVTTEVTENVAVSSGGGISSDSTTLRLEDSAVTGNLADMGGGIEQSPWDGYGCSGGVVATSTATVIRSRITGNTANEFGGGAVVGAGGTVVSEGSDWGSGADDNVADDLYLSDPFEDDSAPSDRYGADASFVLSSTLDPSFCELQRR